MYFVYLTEAWRVADNGVKLAGAGRSIAAPGNLAFVGGGAVLGRISAGAGGAVADSRLVLQHIWACGSAIVNMVAWESCAGVEAGEVGNGAKKATMTYRIQRDFSCSACMPVQWAGNLARLHLESFSSLTLSPRISQGSRR